MWRRKIIKLHSPSTKPNWISSLLILIERTQSYEEDKALAVIYFCFSYTKKKFSRVLQCVSKCARTIITLFHCILIKTNFLDVCLSKLCSILFLNVLFPPPPSSAFWERIFLCAFPFDFKRHALKFINGLSLPKYSIEEFRSHENRMNYDIKACGLSEGFTRLEEGS